MQLNNLNIAVLGAGRSGRAAARLAMTHGARVCVFDASSSIDGWPEDIPLHTAATEEDGRAFHADLVVISPGDRKSTRLNSSHNNQSRMPSSA